MNDHRAEYLATIDEFNELARPAGIPESELGGYGNSTLFGKAELLLEAAIQLRVLKRLLADVDAVEPEPDWRGAFFPPLKVTTYDNGDFRVTSAAGRWVSVPSSPGNLATMALFRHIVECVNAAEAKRGKACCINCDSVIVPAAGPWQIGADARFGGIGPLCRKCYHAATD